MFNPSRLTLARKRRKLSGKELATAINVSPVTISRLEKAINEPETETLNSLVKTLGFPKAFFFGNDIDELNKDAASFRSLTSMTAKERDAALSAGAIAYILSDWISKHFNLPEVDVPDFGKESDPASAARSIREHWGLGEKPIADMIKLLESKGIRVFSLSENTRSVDAFSCWRNDTPYIFLNTLKSAEHSRFDAAHELGHLVLHRHGAPGGSDQKTAETEANAFASSFLMPQADIVSRVHLVTSIDQLIQAKSRWKVSLAALTYRLHKLKILSDWQSRMFFIEIGRRGFRTAEPNPIDREVSYVLKTVFDELWSEKVTKNHIANELGIPVDEIEGLIFGLISTIKPTPPTNSGVSNRTKLTLV